MSKNKEESERKQNYEKKYCVYVHINKINDKKYIGITSRTTSKRWRKNGEGYKSSPHFYNAIKKYGWNNFEHLVIFKELSEEDAKNKERDLISKYKTINKNYGYNCTLGGDGINGYKRTEEQKEQMRRIKLGTKCSEETKEIMRKIMTGRKFTEEWKQKISESHMGDKNPSAKPIVQLSSNYELIKEFSCARYAEQELGINVTHISAVCLGKEKSAGGYIFMFKEDYEKQKDNLKGKSVNIKPHKRQVVQLSSDGQFIGLYKTIKEASKINNIDKSSIINVCKGKKQKTAGCYKWMYKEDYDLVLI